MTRLVVLGDVMVDVVCRLDGPIALGSDAPARIEFGYGGSAANVAAWAARASAGGAPALAGRIGADERGRAAEAELRAAGVDTRLAVDPERPTGTCVVLVGPDGERSMIPDPGANDRLAEADLPDELLVAGTHLHLTGYSLLRDGSRPAARSAIARARERGISVSVDPSSAALLSPAFLDELAGVGLLLPNAVEAAVLSGEGDAERAAIALAARVPEVVVTLGAGGALWTDGREVCRAAVADAPAVEGGSDEEGGAAGAALDTTGAGDAFAAGFLVARLSGAEPEAALRSGCRLAGLAVRTPGARPV
ncbi:MAG TPA: carbohydrate kinase family protein [Thermoleophilaceae bacterium]|nr:carbohydrate kinase family protein [Thermoleophilaceae bacterium]